MQHGENRLIPLDYDEFNWFDNEYFKWYICKFSGVQYLEQDFFDAVGYGVWAEQFKTDFEC